MRRYVKNAVKSGLSRLFHLGQWFGFDILPRHFYSEIPNIARLKATDDWRRVYSFHGVNGTDLDDQLQFVRCALTPEVVGRLAKCDIYQAACQRNGQPGYGPIEADFLYAFIATLRPRNIFQIGCGVSTAVCLAAAQETGYSPNIACVDPYPTSFLERAASSGEIHLIAQPIELQDPGIVSNLEAGDLFFVDSTHALGPAGEVSRIILELLPRLTPGVYVHFHDIYFPYDYPGDLLTSAIFFHHESVLLHAFLAFNAKYKIMVSLSMLHYGRPGDLVKLLPNYQPRMNQDGLRVGPGHFPSSTYLKVIH